MTGTATVDKIGAKIEGKTGASRSGGSTNVGKIDTIATTILRPGIRITATTAISTLIDAMP